MRILVCVDDTDDLTKSTSTGKIAELISDNIVANGGVIDRGITRHQLLLHDDIDYTSHNSSMCMAADLEVDGEEEAVALIEKLRSESEAIIRENMAAVADPGLCICRLDKLQLADRLISYGKRAQKEVLTKEIAYAMAEEIGGTILEEYGGTGIGVIGALAGAGLRLSGCDGTFRGSKGVEFLGKTMRADQWIGMFGIEQVVDMSGSTVPEDTEVTLNKKLKLSILEGKKTLVVREKKGAYVSCSKKDLMEGDKKISTFNTSCEDFAVDNDNEECYTEEERACYNCLYRRWTSEGFICVKK